MDKKIIIGEYEIDMEEIIDEIKKIDKKEKKVLIQLPDGLKKDSEKIVKELEKIENVKVYLWLDTAFGSCDLPINEAKQLGIDLLIHIGHERFIKSFMP